jgi:hypothetical protein
LYYGYGNPPLRPFLERDYEIAADEQLSALVGDGGRFRAIGPAFM